MKLIRPDWQAPANIHGFTTTRLGGCSEGVYAGLNLGDHVADDPARVAENRRLLAGEHGWQAVQWLQQTHSTIVVEASAEGNVPEADACWTDKPGQVCIVMTADCLPVFISSADGSRVAVAHAGWRGLVDGVVENTLQVFSDQQDVHIWLGPAIGPDAFEVGEEVRQQFCDFLPASETAFKPSANAGKWLADIYQLARLRLQHLGIERISGGEHCTFTQADDFYSYRRDGVTGRMASAIWIAN
ncbi:peptidoglycan editing factor PgeF [Aliamphritea spongicola]|uniref:peptidoglycan editing factor PgeF n=1 Tax=Aliamphritea spongicola TaxID=707589 RepID=UPI00196AB52E|nr:peptidoglycan editing factor PgeF [Aliamphritea spongicola]MBN3564745.1 peptidoglycan editing factor PgeF [Aliamphritea spongicola]